MTNARRALRRTGGWKTQLGYYAMFLVPALWMLLFSYLPMAGIYLAFIDYKPAKGVFGSAFVGLKFFKRFFSSIDCRRIITNTLMYNIVRIVLLNVIVGMVFALLLYEIKSRTANKIFQTAMLLPSFLSWTVVSAAPMMLLHPSRGVLNEILALFGLSPVSWYKEPKYWPTIIQLSYIYKSAGMASIYYFAALLSIDMELFDAASIDGAGRLRQIWHISMPALSKVLAITLITQMGSVLASGVSLFYELTLDSKALYETTQVIGTYTYHGITTGRFSFTAALSFFQSVIGLALVLLVNGVIRRVDPDGAMF